MNQSILVEGTIYLKSGVIVHDNMSFTLDENMDKDTILLMLDKIKENVRTCIRSNHEFEFTFGSTIFRGSDISAISLNIVED